MKFYGDELDRRGLARRMGDLAAAGGVRKVVLDDGSERGVRALEFRTAGGLEFDVLIDRAMDIGAARASGRSFGWASATGFRHPGLHEYADEGGISWLRSFSGLTVTAGLDHTLFTAEVDASQYHYPHRQTVWNGLHGRVANIPASLIGAGERWEGERCTLWAEGIVKQTAVFGEHLELRRRVEAPLDGAELHLIDEVTNRGFSRTPHMFLYHINLGWPLLDAGARVVAPIEKTVWCTDSVFEQEVSYQTMPGPQPDFVEQVYEHRLVADADGRVRVALVNERKAFGVSVEWPREAFPHFFEWLHLREGAYAVGLEPSTHAVEGEPEARERGTLIWLEHGESRRYHTVFRVLEGREAIDKTVREIEAVQRQPDADVPEALRP